MAFVLTHRSDSDRSRYSASLQALAIERSLGRRGVPVVRVHPGGRELSLASRYCWRAEDCPNVHESEPALYDFLIGLAARYGGITRVLIPASDDTAYFLGRYREKLSVAYRVVAPGADTIECIIDKRRQLEAAQKLGIPIPETYFPRDTAQLEALAPRLEGYPYIIKPNVAHRWRLARFRQRTGSSGFKALLARDPHELVAQYRRVADVDRDLMVQRVVQGEDQRLYGFFGYFDERSRPLAICLRSKIRQLPSGFGYCTLIESCRDDAVVRQSIRLLQGLNYHGIVGVEWKHDAQSGERLLIEINARATNTTALPPACGVDVPWIAFADATGHRVEPVTRWKTGVKWLWCTPDLWAARELGLGVLGWLESLRGPKCYAVYAADDAKPFLLDFAMFLKAQLGRRLRRLFDHLPNRRSYSLRTTR